MPDSTSYIEFQSYRGAGYPLFLSIFLSLGLSLQAITLLQTVLFFTSLAFLALSFSKRFNSLLGAIGLIVLIGLNPAITRFNFTIITESVYFSSLFLFTAVFLSLPTKRARYKHIILSGLFTWLILIKPVSWAFIAIPFFILWQSLTVKGQTLKILLYFLLGFVIIQSLGTVYRPAVHEDKSVNSFFGSQLIGKLAFASFDPKRKPYPEAAEKWLDIMQPSIEARSSYMDNMTQDFLFSLNTYDFLRFNNMPLLVNEMGVSKENVGEAQKQLAISIIKQNPKAYAYDVALSFYNLWAIGEVQTHNTALIYNEKLNAITKQYDKKIPHPYYLSNEKTPVPYILKALLLLMFTINISLVIYGLFKHVLAFKPLPNEISLLFTLACSVNAYFFLTALFQAGLTRYAVVGWPLNCIILIGTTIYLMQLVFSKNISMGSATV